MKKGPQVAVASVHTHFNIFRNCHDPKEGEVTIAEQITAAGRFLRWHQRQVEVGENLLRKLEKELQAQQSQGVEPVLTASTDQPIQQEPHAAEGL